MLKVVLQNDIIDYYTLMTKRGFLDPVIPCVCVSISRILLVLLIISFTKKKSVLCILV